MAQRDDTGGSPHANEWSHYSDEMSDPCKLFINYIPSKTHERELEKFFSQFGPTGEVSIWRNRESKQSLGKGSVGFLNEKDAQKCLASAQGGLCFNGSYLVVDYLKRNSRNRERPIRNHQPAARVIRENNKTTTPNEEENKSNSPVGHLGEIHINDLPYHVFVQIFSNLCLRDLCTVEKGLFKSIF